MRAIALKTFTFIGDDGRERSFKEGFAREIAPRTFEAWRRNGLVARAPDVIRSIPEKTPALHDDGAECWLQWEDFASPKVPRKSAMLALAAWMTVEFGINPDVAEAAAFRLWAWKILKL